MAEIFAKLNQMIEDFPPSEQKVGRYILDPSNNVMGLSVEQLSNNSGASKAAVIRFCKTLGYKGYRDFALQLTTEVAMDNKDGAQETYKDINVGDDVETIVRNVSYHNAKAIEDSLMLTDVALVQRAADLLYRAQHIDFYGMGASGIVAEDSMYKFMRINKYTTAYGDPHLQLTSAANLGKNDVAVAISWSGETKDTLMAARLAKESGAAVISITRYGNTSLESFSDIHFGLSAPEATIRCGATSSRMAQLNMVDMLFYCIVSQHYGELQKFLDRSRQVVKSKRKGS